MRFTLALTLFLLLSTAFAIAEQAHIHVPRIDHPLTVNDFAGMQPRSDLEGKLAVVQDFVQSSPRDGAPATQKTIVYLAYDDQNLYVIFLCFDSHPDRIAASLSRRESFSGDEDWVEFYLDTFNDKRRAYCFSTNAFGVQWDSRYSEATGGSEDMEGGHQPSFDALWYSEGKLTEQGYLVSMKIPFKSIRFPAGSTQTWRILFGRSVPRNSEYAAWPHVSQSIQGRLSQSSLMTGLQNISPGKNLQFIPYSTFRSFRLLDTESDPPGFIKDLTDTTVGLDTKLVLKDSFVFDLALNPDFSQVESDEPQVTVNQRFEVFFPEKRPFFLENAQYFETPLNLVFTRRIADPQVGGRLTAKSGPYTVGVLYANDEAPGKLVPEEHLHSGSNANFGVVRLARDLFSQSSVGLLFTSRTFEGSENQVLGADFLFRLDDHWDASGQFVRSWNQSLDDDSSNGAAYFAQLKRSGRNFDLNLSYEDLSPEFQTLTGFIPRVDYRSVTLTSEYLFRPEGNIVVAWGPELEAQQSWDYDGTRLDSIIGPAFTVELQRLTNITVQYVDFQQRIRPVDFPGLSDNIDFSTPFWSFDFETSYWKWGTIRLSYEQGKDLNFEPVEGEIPFRGDAGFLDTSLLIRPMRKWQLRNRYVFSSLRSPQLGSVFNDHIFSVRSNYQFTPALSLRLILQYENTIANRALTSLEDRRNFNVDVLFTYLLNPWTALYIGYNGNRQNLDLLHDNNGAHVIRTHDRLINDANQFFVKFSYLFRL